MNIYYYFPLRFHFNSGQTIQILRDYKHLSHLGYSIFLYGTYDDPAAIKEVRDYIGSDPIHLTTAKGSSRLNRNLLKLRFLTKMITDRSAKWVLSRNYNKIKEILSLKRLLGKATFGLELHEDALPYLCKQTQDAKKMQSRFAKLFQKLDFLLLTNYSQEPILKEQFSQLPRYAILPNGVEFDHFHRVQATPLSPHHPIVITYAGQFTRWKNIELLFHALSLLPKQYHLRIAGGKGDEASRLLIQTLTTKYQLEGRVDFKGFVQPRELIDTVLKGSSVLALPLGDNMESKHFTSPMKLIEYMATKIPVVAVNYPSVQMLTGDDSVFLSQNDPHAFAQTIKEATSHIDSKRIENMNAIANAHRYENRSLRYHEAIQQLRS
jgi:glycosyltransferase involved in cell wall biosynthesis